jgi:endonuclease G
MHFYRNLLVILATGQSLQDHGACVAPSATPGSTPICTPLPLGIKTLKYRGFELSYNCLERTALRWHYTLGHDTGIAKRPTSFYFDPNMPVGCLQQKTTASYRQGYDRGHLVASNDMDADDDTILESHYMNNVVPQISSFNQGLWRDIEVLTDCLRDVQPVTIYGGVIYSDPSNDIFVDRWGIQTPDWFWKVLVTTDEDGTDKIISWAFPNSAHLADNLDEYLVAVSDIEAKLTDGLGPIPVPIALKRFKAATVWPTPVRCDPRRR